MRHVLILLIRAYKLLLSPFLGQNCRFHPSCANYAQEAIQLHGSLRGSWLSIRRIVKCQPLHPGGFDPVPGSDASDSEMSCDMAHPLTNKPTANT